MAVTVGCATQPPRCQRLDTNEDWHRLLSPPDFVVAETYEKMFPHGVPDRPEKFAWYSQSPDRFAACLPGDRFGCGDFVVYFSGSRLDDLSDITLCGASRGS